MNARVFCFFLSLALLPVAAFCAPADQPSGTAGPGGVTIEQPGVQAALVGRLWRLVEIASMNDELHAPDDRSLYTFTLRKDGTVQLMADCNRGTGSWTSTAPGKLQFGNRFFA